MKPFRVGTAGFCPDEDVSETAERERKMLPKAV